MANSVYSLSEIDVLILVILCEIFLIFYYFFSNYKASKKQRKKWAASKCYLLLFSVIVVWIVGKIIALIKRPTVFDKIGSRYIEFIVKLTCHVGYTGRTFILRQVLIILNGLFFYLFSEVLFLIFWFLRIKT